ncbi:MAG: hypothetical protein V5A13_11230 [Haloarculaceae archaeon]
MVEDGSDGSAPGTGGGSAVEDSGASDDGPAGGGDADGGDGSRPVTAPLLFLVGLIAFAGGAVGFLADLVTGHDILRSLLVNGGGAGLLVTWAAVDTLGDPDARVATATGAAGTALLLYGLYMVVAGLLVAATTFRHGRLWLGVGVSASGAAGMLVGFLVFPRESVLGGEEGTGEEPRGDERGE